MNLTQRILIGMALGLALGVFFQATDLVSNGFVSTYVLNGVIDAGGKIFVTLLKMMVVPLVFVSLVCGAASLGATGSVGRLGGKTIGLYLATTALAVSLALMLALVIDPGLSAADEQNSAVAFDAYQAKEAPSVKDTLINIFPSNPIQAMADGKMLQVIIFALLFGLALSHAGAAGGRISSFFADLNEVMMKLITMVIQLTPYGVFCLMVKLGATVGWVEIGKVLAYFLTVASALILHGLVVYPTLLRILAGINPLVFLRKMREPMLVAFSTSSSGATLPVTLRTVEHRIGGEQ
jgi:Na+/H+-dicarboxylate symporter